LDNGKDGDITEVIDVELMRRRPSAWCYLFCIAFLYLIRGTLCGQHTGSCYQESLLDPVAFAVAIEDGDELFRRFAIRLGNELLCRQTECINVDNPP